jgi:hypothetical protein
MDTADEIENEIENQFHLASYHVSDLRSAKICERRFSRIEPLSSGSGVNVRCRI